METPIHRSSNFSDNPTMSLSNDLKLWFVCQHNLRLQAILADAREYVAEMERIYNAAMLEVDDAARQVYKLEEEVAFQKHHVAKLQQARDNARKQEAKTDNVRDPLLLITEINQLRQQNASLQKRIVMHNPPHPGVTLKGLYIDGMGLTITDTAKALGISRKTLSQIINGHAGITAPMALLLARAFPLTSAELWLGMQQQYDIWQAQQNEMPIIQPLYPTQP